METPRGSNHGFPFAYVIAGAVILILVVLAIPIFNFGCIVHGQTTQTLNNARQIYIATLRMVTDLEVTPDVKLGWPGDLPDVQNTSDFVERLVEYKYVDRGDLKSLFYAPGVKAYSGTGAFTAENSAFKIYKVRQWDVPQVIFLSTKNFTFGQPLDSKAVPYGNKDAIIFRKGGEGVIINNQQATHSGEGNIGYNSGGTSMADVGPPTAALR